MMKTRINKRFTDCKIIFGDGYKSKERYDIIILKESKDVKNNKE